MSLSDHDIESRHAFAYISNLAWPQCGAAGFDSGPLNARWVEP